jgi:glucokinase
MRSRDPVVALDVGGSSVKSGRVVDGRPDGRVIVTPLVRDAPADELVDRLAAAVAAVAPDAAMRVAAAVPDPFDHVAGVSLMTHKFAALQRLPLAPLLRERVGRPLEIRWCNDAAAAIAGEAIAGAGSGYGRVLGVTLGTGLGAALVVDGAVVPRVGTTVVGDLWQATLADGQRADTAFAARTLLAAVERDPAEGGSAFGSALGRFLAPVVDAAAADVVVVGGGGAGSFDQIAAALRAELGVPVVRATLGPWAALLGATHICWGSGVTGRDR